MGIKEKRNEPSDLRKGIRVNRGRAYREGEGNGG